MFLTSILSLILLPSTIAFADFSGRVVGVSDGDTIKVLHDGMAEKIRLFGIDSPEKGQAFGTRAKQFTSEMAFGKDVTIKEHGLDRYGRTLGEVMLPDGTSLNRELLTAGLAWWFCRYSKDLTLKALEEWARTEKRGLWADPKAIPPWCFRHPQQECKHCQA